VARSQETRDRNIGQYSAKREINRAQCVVWPQAKGRGLPLSRGQWRGYQFYSGTPNVADLSSEFKNKNILVTGAGRGIGKRLALGFAKLGSRIALLGRSKAEIDLAHIEIEQAGGNALRIRADVRDPEQLTLAVDRVRVVFGSSVDVLICAAATMGPIHPFMQTPLRAWTETVESNLFGVVHSFRAVLPSMAERRVGKIIVLTCNSDSLPENNLSAYTTSKTALVRLVEAISAEVAEHNVQINCFDPGLSYTNMTDEIIRAENRLEARVVSAAKETRRTGGVAADLQLKLAIFLASEQSNHITGKLIHVTDDTNKLRNETWRPDALTLRRLAK
jgi:NAD(P)-dependent dehydrogenase (short-subunit alcohol dehydrogenase family)